MLKLTLSRILIQFLFPNFQVVQGDELITYQTQHETPNQQEIQYETVTADQIIQQSDGQPVAQFYIQQAVSTGVGEDGEEVLQYQYIPIYCHYCKFKNI